VPALLPEVLGCCQPAAGDVVADCTLGYGGHAAAIGRRIGPAGRLIGLDVDGRALDRARRRLAGAGLRVAAHRRNFADLPAVLSEEGVDGCDVILADLGVSSMQIDDPARGIGYAHDGPLDMRMDDRLTQTGADLLGRLSPAELSAALRDLADEPDHQRIAEWIVNQRSAQPITRVDQLVRLVMDAKGVGPRRRGRSAWNAYGRRHPAARTFQALRILVNDELASLRRLLAAAPSCLKGGGRIAVISFHSGEDRLVKAAFRAGRRRGVYAQTSPQPLTPRAGEVRRNPRAASARLRWARRAPGGEVSG
jgi:16S rRNA (cytosine1402-N4)-methyltransferase